MVGLRIDDFVANVVALIKDGGTLVHLFGPGGSDDCWLGLVWGIVFRFQSYQSVKE